MIYIARIKSAVGTICSVTFFGTYNIFTFSKVVYVGEQFTVYGLYNKPVCSALIRKFGLSSQAKAEEVTSQFSNFSHNKQRLIVYLYGLL